MKLNSSPVDELGDGACQSGRQFRGKPTILEPQAMSRAQGFHGNSASGHHPPGTVTLTKSVEILTSPILTESANERGKGREGGKSGTTEGLLLETNSTSHSRNDQHTGNLRNPVCHHDSLTITDQHWLDFNLA